MARFVEMTLPGDGGHTVYVNIDRITYMRPQTTHPNRTILHFDGEQNLMVQMEAATIADYAKEKW